MVHLHVHNNAGSLLDGFSSCADYAKKAQFYNHKALAVTDHGRLNAIYINQKECLKREIKPIVGVEMYLVDKLEELDKEDKRIRSKTFHIILLVKNKKGYENLLRLNYLSMTDDHFYYSPRILQEELFKHHEGLICGTACIQNPFIFNLRNGKEQEAIDLFSKYVEVFKDDFYAEIQFNELVRTIDELKEGQKTANEFMINQANKNGIPIVMTGDVHYAEKGQDKLQTLAIAIRDKSTIDKLKFELESKELYYHDITDYFEFNERFGYSVPKDDISKYCNNGDVIAARTCFLIPERTKLFIPKVYEDDDSEIIKKGKQGLEKLFICEYKDCPKNYKDRLERELEIIIRKGFSSYFLIVEDLTRFSKNSNIYGRFGRGSVGGSLLAYVLGIHNLDPIKMDLLFERFLSESRSSDLVLSYLKEE
jgi:DNA polymerase-3 subunit alpha